MVWWTGAKARAKRNAEGAEFGRRRLFYMKCQTAKGCQQYFLVIGQLLLIVSLNLGFQDMNYTNLMVYDVGG